MTCLRSRALRSAARDRLERCRQPLTLDRRPVNLGGRLHRTAGGAGSAQASFWAPQHPVVLVHGPMPSARHTEGRCSSRRHGGRSRRRSCDHQRRHRRAPGHGREPARSRLIRANLSLRDVDAPVRNAARRPARRRGTLPTRRRRRRARRARQDQHRSPARPTTSRVPDEESGRRPMPRARPKLDRLLVREGQ
jgi:hypothetical protein